MEIFVLFLIFVSIALTASKISFIKKRAKALKIEAEVVEYRWERSSMRNDNSKLNYPYVKITSEDGDYVIKKLHYANNWSKSFEIGQRIYVFWKDNKLLYWEAMDKGFMSIFPSRLDFWN